MKKKRGKQRSGSLLAPLTDEEFADLMRDKPPRIARDDIALHRCPNCNTWEPYGSRDARMCLNCFRRHDDA